MGILKTAGKIAAAPVTVPVKATAAVAKGTYKATKFTAETAVRAAAKTADGATFNVASSAYETYKSKKK